MKNLTKRIFAIGAILFLFLNNDYAQANAKKLFTGQIGVQPYTFRKVTPFGTEATLDIIKKMGFTEVEGSNGGVNAKDYKKMCDKRGLKITSMGTGYKDLIEDPMSVVKTAKIYGAKYVMCAWIPHNTGSFNFANAKKAVEDFNKAGKVLYENGITLTYHAHGYEVAAPHEGGTLLDYIVNNTDSRYLNFEMDIFWIAFGGGDPAQLLRKYPTRWKLMHLKDMQKDIKKDHTGLTNTEFDVALGKGQLDMKGILKAAKEVGIAHYFIEDESNRIFEQLPESIKFLKETVE
jgi:sugar phosphate isomerase/epimerase